jgi:hypothetical protein
MLPPPAGSRQSSYAYTLPVTLPRSSSTYSKTNPNRRPTVSEYEYEYDTAEAGPSSGPRHGPRLSLPRRSTSRLRPPDYGVDHGENRNGNGNGNGESDGVDETEAEELRAEMGVMEDEEGRGLEETLEKIGFGAYQWRLLVSILSPLAYSVWSLRCLLHRSFEAVQSRRLNRR